MRFVDLLHIHVSMKHNEPHPLWKFSNIVLKIRDGITFDF